MGIQVVTVDEKAGKPNPQTLKRRRKSKYDPILDKMIELLPGQYVRVDCPDHLNANSFLRSVRTLAIARGVVPLRAKTEFSFTQNTAEKAIYISCNSM